MTAPSCEGPRRARATTASPCIRPAVRRGLCRARFGPQLLHMRFQDAGKDWRWLYRVQASVARADDGVSIGARLVDAIARPPERTKKEWFYWGRSRRRRVRRVRHVPAPAEQTLRCRTASRKERGSRSARCRRHGSRGRRALLRGPVEGRQIPRPRRPHRRLGDTLRGRLERGPTPRVRRRTLQGHRRLQGHWQDNARRGHGICRYAVGAAYEGDWRDGVRHGRGVYTFASCATYDGDWADGRKKGHGKARYAVGAVYTGQWQEDLRDGQGTLVCPSGSRYRGQFRGGRRWGRGPHRWTDGARHAGAWADDRVCGFGVRVLADGRRVRGVWAGQRQPHEPARTIG